jgi:UDP-N-acetyl-2-amino-2-deoxyglucuronate dehydrogenase
LHKIAIIGCGRISGKHIDAVKQLEAEGRARLVACCDIMEERALKAAGSFDCRAYTDYAKLLKEAGADLVSLCTPSGIHPAQAEEAARAGVNILSEKPQGCSLEACDRAIEAADRAGVKDMVVKQNRFNPTIRLLRRAYEAGRFGRLYMILANVLWTRPQDYYDMAPWRGTYELDGGCLSNQASHYVDMVQWFGGKVSDVSAQYSTQKIRMEAEDTISVSIKFEGGAIGNINATVLTYPKNLEGSLTLLGDKGTARVGGFALNKIEHWQFDGSDPMDEEATSSDTAPTSVYGSGHLPFYRHVLDVLDGKAEPLCPAREARKTVEIIARAYESGKSL